MHFLYLIDLKEDDRGIQFPLPLLKGILVYFRYT